MRCQKVLRRAGGTDVRAAVTPRLTASSATHRVLPGVERSMTTVFVEITSLRCARNMRQGVWKASTLSPDASIT